MKYLWENIVKCSMAGMRKGGKKRKRKDSKRRQEEQTGERDEGREEKIKGEK